MAHENNKLLNMANKARFIKLIIRDSTIIYFVCNRTRNEHFACVQQAAKLNFAAVTLTTAVKVKIIFIFIYYYNYNISICIFLV
jgi:hypothetical protein